MLILVSLSATAQDCLPEKAVPDGRNKKQTDSIKSLIEKNKQVIKNEISYEDAFGNTNFNLAANIQLRAEFIRQKGISVGLHMMPSGNYGFPDFDFYYKHPIAFLKAGKKLMKFEKTYFDENSMIRMMHNVVNWNAVLWQVEYRQKHGKKAYEQLMRKHGIKM